MKILGLLVALIAMIGLAGAQTIAQSQSTSVATVADEGVEVSVDVSVVTNGGLAAAMGHSNAYNGVETAGANALVSGAGTTNAEATGYAYSNVADGEAMSMAMLDLYADWGLAYGDVEVSTQDGGYTIATGANIEGINVLYGWTDAIVVAAVTPLDASSLVESAAEIETGGISGVEASAGATRVEDGLIADVWAAAAGETEDGFAGACAYGMVDTDAETTLTDVDTGIVGNAVAYAGAYANIEELED